ncbi:hypothetical protein [Tianweitania sediminis]|uniref:Uncharacterized protein n=1 Tax=Tianweitania sediminis TaxID=1502156 RepID=A0A8J7R5D9_9HYPH|nr:hypothetical protein [Tianweitania sediminis]MBP0437982.1 hypothetical protein [Tianweitania sediminis]
MNLNVFWERAEQMLVSDRHCHNPAQIAALLEAAGFPCTGAGAYAVHELLWSTATKESNRVHLFLAITSARADQVAEVGLDRLGALQSSFRRQSLRQPELADYVDTAARSVAMAAFATVIQKKRDLLAFLGSQSIGANSSGIEFQRLEVLSLGEALELVSANRGGILRLRGRIGVGCEYFDRYVSRNWERWSPVLKADFLGMLDQEMPDIDPVEFLDIFQQALIGSDWRDDLAAELVARGSGILDAAARLRWEAALNEFEPVDPEEQAESLGSEAVAA